MWVTSTTKHSKLKVGGGRAIKAKERGTPIEERRRKTIDKMN